MRDWQTVKDATITIHAPVHAGKTTGTEALFRKLSEQKVYLDRMWL